METPRPEQMGEQAPLGVGSERILVYTEYGMQLVGNGEESKDELALFRVWLEEKHNQDVADKIWRNLGLMGW